MRRAYFAGVRGSLRVTHHEGDIHVCSPIATDDLFGDLVEAMGDMSDDGDGPALLADLSAIDASMVRRQLSLRRAAADSDRIDLDHLSMVSIRGEGCYAHDDSGSWSRVSPPEQRRRLLEVLTG
jgi:hypothetical protein